MSSTDGPGAAGRLDRAIVDALAAEPSPAARALVAERVSRALADRSSIANVPHERWPSGPLLGNDRFRRLALIGAALLAATSLAAAAGMTRFEQTLQEVEGWRVAWERGERLGISDTVDGRTLTLERAYADQNSVFPVVHVEGGDRAAVFFTNESTLVDSRGRSWPLWHGHGLGGGNFVSIFETPRDAGARESFTLAVRNLDARFWTDETPRPSDASPDASFEFPLVEAGAHRPWRFRFSLPVHRVPTVTPNLRAARAGVTIKLREVRISPVTAFALVELDGPDIGAESWSPIARLEGAGVSIPIALSSLRGYDGTVIRLHLETTTGAYPSSGEWRLIVEEVVGWDQTKPDALDGQIRIAGPWVFEFDMP